MQSTLTSNQRDLLRTWLADRPRRTIATWHLDCESWTVTLPSSLSDTGYEQVTVSRRVIRVTLTTWGRRDVLDQEGITVRTLGDAWHIVTTALGLPQHVAADRDHFLAWATLGKR